MEVGWQERSWDRFCRVATGLPVDGRSQLVVGSEVEVVLEKFSGLGSGPKCGFPRVKTHRLGKVSQVVRFHAETRGWGGCGFT